ncbi:MAG: hypothetical protein F6K28_53695 [Microcoleus sp. SIO2G3]|nr:hypothetical protein [Microcoleus sp. SIO2G3]
MKRNRSARRVSDRLNRHNQNCIKEMALLNHRMNRLLVPMPGEPNWFQSPLRWEI